MMTAHRKAATIVWLVFVAVSSLVLIATAREYVAGFKNNWDTIGYSGVVNRWLGLPLSENHRATYQSLKESVSDRDFRSLTSLGQYRADVFSDPKLFEQQLPFYEIKPLYILTIVAVSQITNDHYFSMKIISCVGYVVVLMVIYLFLVTIVGRHGVAFCLTVLAGGLPYTLDLFRLSTPDALGAAAALGAVYAMLVRRWPILATLLVATAIGLRPDYAALGVILGFIVLMRGRADWRYAALLTGLAVAMYFAITRLFGAYGYVTFFNFSLIKPRVADLSLLPTHYDIALFARSALQYAVGDHAFMLMALISVAIILVARRGIVEETYHLCLVAIAFAAVKFAIYPAEMSRQMIFSYLLFLVAMVQLIQVRVTHGRATTRPDAPGRSLDTAEDA